MAIDRIPGVGPQNSDIATAVAAAVPTTAGITSIVQANAGSPYGGTWTNLGYQQGNGVSSVTFSGLSSYKYLKLFVVDLSGNLSWNFRLNGDTSTIYSSTGWNGSTSGPLGPSVDPVSDKFGLANGSNASGVFEFWQTNGGTFKMGTTLWTVAGNNIVRNLHLLYGSTSAISSLTFNASGNMTQGTGKGFFMLGAN